MASEKGSMTVANAIKDIEVEKIQGPSESELVKVGSFWENQTAVVHILRRFGCRLCRANALELQKIVPILEANNIRVVAVGIEKLGLEEFQQGGYWNGELYIDNEKKIHRALEIKSVGVLGTLNMLVANKDVKKALSKTKGVPGNLKGDGRQLGATFVISKGGNLLMDFRQQDFASHPSNESILKASGLDPSLCFQNDVQSTETVGICDDKCSI
eukprot:c9304_g1_i1 orf=344-985(-)